MSSAQDEFNDLMRDKDRRTNHPEDDGNDDTRSFLNISDDDEPTTPASSRASDAPQRPSMSLARSTIPHTRYEANTGPKGVIADAQHFRDSHRIHRNSIRGLSSLASQTQSITLDPTVSEKLAEDGGDDIDEDDLLDEGFMQKWRQSRLQQLQTGGLNGASQHSRASSRRLYGSLTTVDGEGYLNAVDKSPPGTVVIVYIYDDYSHVSVALEECIRDLAGKHQDARFVRLPFEEAEMEPVGIPALIAYRNGDKFAGLVPLIDEMPEGADLSANTLEAVLKRHQILR